MAVDNDGDARQQRWRMMTAADDEANIKDLSVVGVGVGVGMYHK